MYEAPLSHSEGAIESRARRAARRNGWMAMKSRRQISIDNEGGWMLVDARTNCVVAGLRFSMTPEEVIDYCAAAAA
jgi:hypothetical protein